MNKVVTISLCLIIIIIIIIIIAIIHDGIKVRIEKIWKRKSVDSSVCSLADSMGGGFVKTVGEELEGTGITTKIG